MFLSSQKKRKIESDGDQEPVALSVPSSPEEQAEMKKKKKKKKEKRKMESAESSGELVEMVGA